MNPPDVLLYSSIFLMCYICLCASQNSDKHRCKIFKSWSVKNVAVTYNKSGIVKILDEGRREVHVELIRPGVINETIFKVRCCDGYFENDKKKCKKCPENTYGKNCSGICQCEGYKMCDHVNGECKFCIAEWCEESSEDKLVPGHVGNCTGEDCHVHTAGRDDTDHTALIAALPSLAVSVIVLVVCIVARERYHRSRKRKLELSGQLPTKEAVARYVDSEPIYFEIKDEDVMYNGKFDGKANPIERSKKGNSYVLEKNPDATYKIDTDECGYLNPQSSIRNAKSETNVYQDGKQQEKAECVVIYSTDKSANIIESNTVYNEMLDKNKTKVLMEGKVDGVMEGKPESVYQDKTHTSGDDHVYFVLQKINQETESLDAEQEKLLSGKSTTCV